MPIRGWRQAAGFKVTGVFMGPIIHKFMTDNNMQVVSFLFKNPSF